MADLDQIQLPNGGTYSFVDTAGRKEANLEWGGKNFSASYGCIDAAMVPELGANRLAFIRASAITIEYSRDGGSTWADASISDADKVNLFDGVGASSLVVGNATSSSPATAQYQTRITLSTGLGNVYTVLNKFVLYVTTNGSTSCTCEITAAKEATPDTYEDITSDIPISGWSGYNVINISGLTTYGNTASTQYGRVRFTFKVGNTATSQYYGLKIVKIFGFGGVGWTVPSTMAKNGHLYTYDNSQNATFPAQVTATKFNGALNGNANTATKATQDESGNNIKATYANSFSISDHTITLKNKNGSSLGTVTVPDNNTTYTFANGTNGFTVTPSGGSAQTVTVTPSIANNVTGSGTSGYLTKFNGTNTITNGPALGSDTTTFLRNDGTWAVPPSSGGSGNKIFITEPTPPYSIGDLWLVEDNNISVCVTARASGSFDSNDWGSAIETLSAEELQSTIASAITGAVTVVTGNSESGGNVIWRMNSNNVPYELLITDSPDNITASTARIYRWDANGLRYSSTGYSGTYTTLINTSGQIPAQYLTGNLNAGVVAIQNFTAAMVHGGVLTRGRANNQDGTIEVYDANGTLIAEVTNLGFKYYGPGTGSDRPYYLINTNGFVGYTKIDNVWTQTVKVAFDEFRMIKGYVRDELDIGSMIKIIPMTNGNNSGIAFVAST